MNAEVVLALNPEVIICSGMGGSGATICSNIQSDPVLQLTAAVGNGNMFVIGDPNIIERPGPRIASGLETVYAILNFLSGDVNSTQVRITSPQAGSYEAGSTITLTYSTDAANPVAFYRLDSGFITSFENSAVTISPSTGSHTLTVWVRDGSGGWGMDAVSFTVNPPPSPSSGGGGGSSPVEEEVITVETGPGRAVVTIPEIRAGSTASIQVPEEEDVPLTEIVLKAKLLVKDARITASTLDARPGDVPAPRGAVYRYLDISAEGISDRDVDDLTFRFRVDRTWLSDGVDPSSVRLERFHDGQWQELETTRLREDPTYIYYSAGSPGLSYFAITGEGTVQEETPAPVQTQEPSSPPATTEVPGTPNPVTLPQAAEPGAPLPPDDAPEGKGICGPTLVAVVGLLPIVFKGASARRRPGRR